MTDRFSGARRRSRRAVAWIVGTIIGGSAFAQTTGEIPEMVGFRAGSVVFAPSLTAGYSYDSNVHQLSKDAVPPPAPDQVLTLQPAFVLTVPFSNSMFRLGDVLSYVDYKRTPQTSGKTSNDADADLTLNFGSRDQLELTAHNIAGVAETLAFDLGGEVVFQGNAFQLHNEAVSLSRVLSGARGYRLALQHNALRFDPSISVNFFNYRGFDGEAAYLQPLSSNALLSFGYLASRYDHSYAYDPSTVVRTETGDTAYVQLEGELGPRQPYNVRLGWQRLGFSGSGVEVANNFSGLVGQAQLSTIVGGGTTFRVLAQRQPYRSYVVSNNYYVFNLIGLWVERFFSMGSSVGGNLAYSINGYNLPTIVEGSAVYRQDRTVQLAAYASLAISRRAAFRISVTRNRRYSNVEGLDFNSTVVFGGIVLGWI